MKKMRRAVLSKTLKEKRKKIDLIDRKLLKLLNHRLHVALEIGKIKKQMGTKIYDPKREKGILEKLGLRNKGHLEEEDIKKIFRKIMMVCRRSQEELR